MCALAIYSRLESHIQTVERLTAEMFRLCKHYRPKLVFRKVGFHVVQRLRCHNYVAFISWDSMVKGNVDRTLRIVFEPNIDKVAPKCLSIPRLFQRTDPCLLIDLASVVCPVYQPLTAQRDTCFG